MSVSVDRHRADVEAAETRARVAARNRVRQLESEERDLRDDLGARAAPLWAGGTDTESVEQVERDLDLVERDLRRARAAAAYLAG